MICRVSTGLVHEASSLLSLAQSASCGARVNATLVVEVCEREQSFTNLCCRVASTLLACERRARPAIRDEHALRSQSRALYWLVGAQLQSSSSVECLPRRGSASLAISE